MSKAAPLILPVLRLNTRLWSNCLRDVTNDLAWRRPAERINSLGFVALHVLDARYFMASYLGLQADNPFQDALADVRSNDDLPADAAPSVATMAHHWRTISRTLVDGLPTLGDAAWERPSPTSFPIDDATLLGGVLFLTQHESYHIGQLGLLRRYWGLPAMRYGSET